MVSVEIRYMDGENEFLQCEWCKPKDGFLYLTLQKGAYRFIPAHTIKNVTSIDIGDGIKKTEE